MRRIAIMLFVRYAEAILVPCYIDRKLCTFGATIAGWVAGRVHLKELIVLALHLQVTEIVETSDYFLGGKEMMNLVRFAALTSVVAVVSMAPIAKADEWNKKTLLTVKEPIQIPQCCGPNIVLQPGNYTFKLLDSSADRHIVQVFDSNDHIITTILAINNYRLRPTSESTFTFWEVPAGQAPALRAWFYPGDNFGQEFAYPKDMSAQIASSAKMTVPTVTAASVEEYKTAPVVATDETGNTAGLDTAVYTPPAPVVVAEVAAPAPAPAPAEVAVVEAAPAPLPVEVPQELPHTASSLPLIGLAGLLSILTFFVVRPARVR
jgi:hypothetical protein